ncbi:MAG: transporter substrate-binding domain-containing protein, partial [Actinomycetota bacterium]|nr:transporter substrate-binding domain-containing protein [Actinomycetota bacterium]
MKTFKRSFGLLLVIGLIAAACGTDGDDDASSSASSSAAVATTAAPVATTVAPAAAVETSEDESTLPDLGGRTVSVAIENAYLPYNYVDAETGEIGGFDYDFFGEICNRLNCELDYVEFAWEATIQSVGDGTFDTAGGGITITAEREETLDFTDSYISV